MINYQKALDLEDRIPGVIREELEACPETGTGERLVFRWVFRMASKLRSYLNSQEIVETIKEYSADCGREVTDAEIVGAIDAASAPRSGRKKEYSPKAQKDVGKKTREERKAELEEAVVRLNGAIKEREEELALFGDKVELRLEYRNCVLLKKDTEFYIGRHRELLAQAEEQLAAIRWLEASPAKRFESYVQLAKDCPESLEILAKWRGLSAGVFDWLVQHQFLGLSCDKREKASGDGFWEALTVVFPVRGADGNLTGFHHRILPTNRRSTFYWFFDPSGTKASPLIIGDPQTADLVIVAESSWDPIAFIDAFELHQQTEIAWAVIITRGAANANRVTTAFKAESTIVLLNQNDNANAKCWPSYRKSFAPVRKRLRRQRTLKTSTIGSKQPVQNKSESSYA